MTSRQKRVSSNRVETFRARVLSYYRDYGRHALPWRKTHNPYRVLVSEVMLQQTQVDRVIPKYKAFFRAFPTVHALANAQLPEVLELWSGLGYNRRARMLHEAAKTVERDYNGRFPKDVRSLESLPGVGPYTARAVAVFAYNVPVVMIETNIRSVFLHEFFSDRTDVPDSELIPLIERTCALEGNSREWYAALMDYGTHLKKTNGNPSRQSKHYTKQAKFDGSQRQIRGAILPVLFKGARTTAEIVRATQFEKSRVEDALTGLTKDGLVRANGRRWEIAT